MRALLKLLSVILDARAASRGPAPYVKRQVRKRVIRAVSRKLR